MTNDTQLISLKQRWSSLWNNFMEHEREMPFRSTILPSHVQTNFQSKSIQKEVHYFTVEINEMYLSYKSKLWVDLDPTVFVTTEFKYNKQPETVPFIVGPAMADKLKQPIPEGMIFSNIQVLGPHPYKGDSLTLSVVLCHVKRGDRAEEILKIVEGASGALDNATALTSYIKVADIVTHGIENLMKINGITPLVGLQSQFHPETNHDLSQNYFVLINTSEDKVKAEELWVKDDCLYKGTSFENCTHYRDADYVLYSIRGKNERDVDMLPFEDLWVRIQQQAIQPDDNSWSRANADMLSLFQTMYLSPDMTKKHALALRNDRIAEMNSLHGVEPDPKLDLLGTLSDKKSKNKPKPIAKKKPIPEDKELIADKNLKDIVDILKL
jgi:hypothetical protein